MRRTVKKGNYHLAVLIALIMAALTLCRVDVDRLGEKIYGPKWHLRDIDQKFRENRAFYRAWKSVNLLCRGDLSNSFKLFPTAPFGFAIMIFEIFYRVYILIMKAKPARAIVKIRTCAAVGLILAIAFQLLVPIGVNLL